MKVRSETAGQRLSASEVAEFTHQVAGLVQSGMPLASGLQAWADELPPGRFRQTLAGLSRQLESGVPLDTAIESQGSRFPGHLRGLVLAGVRSGRLAYVLNEYVATYHAAVTLRRKLMMSFVYPVVLLSGLISLQYFLTVSVTTNFVAIFSDFGIELPFITSSYVTFSSLLAAHVWKIVIAFGLLVLLLFLGTTSTRNFSFGLPLVGTLWRWSSLAEFFRLLGTLIDSEIPLTMALHMSSDSIRNTNLSEASRRAAERIASGQSLADELPIALRLPTGTAPLLRWGEEHHSLGKVLFTMAVILESRARARAAFIRIVTVPIVMVWTLIGISWISFAFFSPVIHLTVSLS